MQILRPLRRTFDFIDGKWSPGAGKLQITEFAAAFRCLPKNYLLICRKD